MPAVMLSQAGHRAVQARLSHHSSAAPAIITRVGTRLSSRAALRRSAFRHASSSGHAARNPTRVQAAAIELGTRAIKKFAQVSKNPVFVAGA
jgi:hypothetical protein